MVCLIWVILDTLAGDHHADNKQQDNASPDHHYRMHQTVLPSPASRKEQVMVFLPAALIERLRHAAYWTGDPPLADLVAETIEDTVTQMEEINGEAFPSLYLQIGRAHV